MTSAPGKKYRKITRDDRRIPRIPETLLNQVLARFCEGESLERLAPEFGVGTATLYRRIPAMIGIHRYRAIIDSQRKKDVPARLLKEAWKRVQNGEQIEKIAKEYEMGSTTLHRKLVKLVGAEKYKETMDRKLNREIPEPMLTEIIRRLCNGEPMTILEREYGIPRLTLRRKVMRRIGRKKYIEIMERTKPLKRRMPPGYGSPKAKLQGADSLLELGIRRLLEEHQVTFVHCKDLQLNGHWYIPDFVIGCIIIEVTGVTIRDYWIRYKRKTRDYLEAGYEVIIVTSDRVYNLATKFLGSLGAHVIRYRDFENCIDDMLRMTSATNEQKHL
jgi:transposase-like protein